MEIFATFKANFINNDNCHVRYILLTDWNRLNDRKFIFIRHIKPKFFTYFLY
jgi:hypothetical protein